MLQVKCNDGNRIFILNFRFFNMLHILVYWATTAIKLIVGYLNFYLALVVNLFDYYAPGWRFYLLSPFVIVLVIFPFLLVVYLYLTALLLFIYHQRSTLIDAFQRRDVWDGYRRTIAVIWSAHGWIWHGYEVIGLENIPDSGPALIIYYHGAFPIDAYYLVSHVYLKKGRVIRNVMDNFAFKIPGLGQLFRFWGSFPGPRSKVVEVLREGDVVSIAPGGVREGLFSENYSLVWKNRIGFAKAAVEAEVPILPMFTENCRQAFEFVGIGKKIFRWFYEQTRWPVTPMYGGFPVKLRTFIGKPIKHDPLMTPEALAFKTRKALKELIDQHQTRPGSVLGGLWQRLPFKSNATRKEIHSEPRKAPSSKLKQNSKPSFKKTKKMSVTLDASSEDLNRSTSNNFFNHK